MQRGLKKLLLISIFTFISLFVTSNAFAIEVNQFNLFKLADKYFITLEFDTDGGNKIQNLNYCAVENCGTENFKLPKPKKDGYVFKGWYADPDYRVSISNEFVKSEENDKLALIPYESGTNIKRVHATLYARFERKGEKVCPDKPTSNIIVKYESNGGTKLEDRIICESCEDVMISLSVPEKEGYYFIGWFSDPDFINVMPYGMVYASEIINNLDLYVADSDDECTDDLAGKVYARWATKEEFNNYIETYVNNELEIISLLTRK